MQGILLQKGLYLKVECEGRNSWAGQVNIKGRAHAKHNFPSRKAAFEWCEMVVDNEPND